MSLAARLAALIRREGPIGVDVFMEAAVRHYYASRDPFGPQGDFTTAPEISQMFGELIALFLAQSWQDQGAPEPVHIVELGPGRGTLMRDLRRTLAKAAPALARAAQIHLVEQSPLLRAAQEAMLGPDLRWHESFETIPRRGALLVIANEFFDALPIRQFVRTAAGLVERRVDVDDAGAFHFVPGGTGPIQEYCPAGEALVAQIAKRIAAQTGTALIIDYGHTQSAPGETLQALKAHHFVPPLVEPGDIDFTAHVDFAALARAALSQGVAVKGPVTQGAFLSALGIGLRAERLKRDASLAVAGEIDAALARLTDEDQMGSLFKVMALARIDAPALAGFS
jgi:SAM-dependent MidA family methyltransferase